MASKRKRSKPTKIADQDASERNSEISHYEDDTMQKIQRFIEEGSEDTPECLQMRLDQCESSETTIQQVESCQDWQSDDVNSSRNLPLCWNQERELEVNNAVETREKRLMLQRLRQAERRKNESAEERTMRLSQNRERQACRRNNESAEERAIRLTLHRIRQADRRKNESPEQRALRLSQNRERQANSRKNETVEARELRLFKNRIRLAESRRREAMQAQGRLLKNAEQHEKAKPRGQT